MINSKGRVNLNGPFKNIQKIVKEVAGLKDAFKANPADQKGWTHQYMQNCRTMVREAVVTSATLLGVVVPAVLTVLGFVLLHQHARILELEQLVR